MASRMRVIRNRSSHHHRHREDRRAAEAAEDGRRHPRDCLGIVQEHPPPLRSNPRQHRQYHKTGPNQTKSDQIRQTITDHLSFDGFTRGFFFMTRMPPNQRVCLFF